MQGKNKKHAIRKLAEDSTIFRVESGESSEPTSVLSSSKANNKRRILFVVIVILAITMIGLTYFILSSKNNDKVVNNQTVTEFASVNELVAKAVSKLDGSVLQNAYVDGLGGKTTNGFGTYGVANYKVGDRKYSNLPAESFGHGYNGNSETASADYAKLVDFFKQNHYREVNAGSNQSGSIIFGGEDIEYVSFATYESDKDLCMIWHADASNTPLENHVASIGCASKDSYKVAADAIDTYYTAYVKGVNNPSSDIVLGVSSVGDGSDGYKHTLIYQEDASETEKQFIGHYYKEPAKNEWTYLTGSYEPLLCSDYNTDVLKKSFKGIDCLSGPSGTLTVL